MRCTVVKREREKTMCISLLNHAPFRLLLPAKSNGSNERLSASFVRKKFCCQICCCSTAAVRKLLKSYKCDKTAGKKAICAFSLLWNFFFFLIFGINFFLFFQYFFLFLWMAKCKPGIKMNIVLFVIVAENWKCSSSSGSSGDGVMRE